MCKVSQGIAPNLFADIFSSRSSTRNQIKRILATSEKASKT